MKRVLLFALLLSSLPSLAAPRGGYQRGTVVRMRMGDCPLRHRGFVSTMAGPQAQAAESCPEYTLVADNVVFVVVGRSSNQLVPLAEAIDFRINKNQLMVRVDDVRHESKFVIREMMLRSQWERMQKRLEQQLGKSQQLPEDSASTAKTQ